MTVEWKHYMTLFKGNIYTTYLYMIVMPLIDALYICSSVPPPYVHPSQKWATVNFKTLQAMWRAIYFTLAQA